MQLTIVSFRPLFPEKDFFPDISLIFSKITDISLTAVKFPDISRFSIQVVTLCADKLHESFFSLVSQMNKIWNVTVVLVNGAGYLNMDI